MASASASPPSPSPSIKSNKLDQLIHHFYIKTAAIISQARVASDSSNKKVDKWFNLETEDIDFFKEELKTWRSTASFLATASTVPAMILDVVLDVNELNSNQVAVIYDSNGSRHRIEQSHKNILLERWALSLLPAPPADPPELPALYKQGIIMFRSLYALVRALPAYALSRSVRKRKRVYTTPGFQVGCRISSGLDDGLSSSSSEDNQNLRRPASDKGKGKERAKEYTLDDRLTEESLPFSAQNPAHFVFAPIHTPIGSLFLECKYRASADFGVEDKEALLSSRFLNEDFFRPSVTSSTRQQRGSVPPQSMQMTASGERLAPSYGSLTSKHGANPVAFPSTGEGSLPRTLSSSPKGLVSSDMRDKETSLIGPSSIKDEEGAFVTAGTMSRTQSRTSNPRASVSSSSGPVSIPQASRASSYSVPFRPGSTTSQPHLLMRTSGSPQSLSSMNRYSAGSFSGPSSSLRYTSISRAHDNSPLPEGAATGTTPPFRPVPQPIQRYSSSKYARSYSSAGSSLGDRQDMSGSPAFGPESLGRRSRLGSFTSSNKEASSSATSASLRALTSGPLGRATSTDVDEINSFLQMIDSRPQLVSASFLGGHARSAVLTKSDADSRLRALADSMSNLASALSSGQASPSPDVSGFVASKTRLQGQSIEEEAAEDLKASETTDLPARRQRSEDAPAQGSIEVQDLFPLPRGTETLPSSYPRYESGQRRQTQIQTGFFPYSASTSPQPNSVNRMATSPPSRSLFPRYTSKSKSTSGRATAQSTTSGAAVEQTALSSRRTSYSGVEEHAMDQIELSMEGSSSPQEGSIGAPSQQIWPALVSHSPVRSPAQQALPASRDPSPSLPAFARGRPRVAMYERHRVSRVEQLHNSSSSASSG